VVLQCRVRRNSVWKVRPQTRRADCKVDPNFDNSELVWLFKPDSTDPVTGLPMVTNAIACTGIMVRITEKHPAECGFWCSSLVGRREVVDPSVKPNIHGWLAEERTCTIWELITSRSVEDWLGNRGHEVPMQPARRAHVRYSPAPFATGSLRLAHYAYLDGEYFVRKTFNAYSVDHFEYALGITNDEAVMKDVRCQLFAGALAKEFNGALLRHAGLLGRFAGSRITYVTPLIISDDQLYFAERVLKGRFDKYNDNIGNVYRRDTVEAKVAAAFSHFTYERTNGLAMVVDAQGVGLNLTDPTVHTCNVDNVDSLFRRFGMGNHGKQGMTRFFASHECNEVCKAFRLIPRRCKKRKDMA